jgi:hypothetical protein
MGDHVSRKSIALRLKRSLRSYQQPGFIVMILQLAACARPTETFTAATGDCLSLFSAAHLTDTDNTAAEVVQQTYFKVPSGPTADRHRRKLLRTKNIGLNARHVRCPGDPLADYISHN